MIRIFSVVIPARVFTLFISEVVLLFACYVAAAFIDPDLTSVGIFLQYDAGLLRIGLVVCFIFLGLFFRNLYTEVRVRNRLELLQNLCMIFGLAFIGQGLISYLDPDSIIPRKVMLVGSALAIVALFAWRLLFDRAARNATTLRRVLFLGMSPTTVKLAGYFEAHPEFGLMSIGYIGTGNDSPAPSSVLRLGSMTDFDSVLDEYMPESIVIGKREDIKPWWVGDFLALRFGGVRIEEASRLYERLFARKCATEIWPSRLIFAAALEPPPANVTLQWFYSQGIALAALVIMSPVMVLAAALIKWSSPGPVLQREKRVGLHDSVFSFYRFRCRDNNGNHTGIGNMLRRCHLDSLPALFNIVCGDMSIVGPQPERPAYVERLCAEIPFYRQRHRVRPGLTGWAGIHCDQRQCDTLRELEYDLYYIENLSPMLDSLILLLALKKFRAPSAANAEIVPDSAY